MTYDVLSEARKVSRALVVHGDMDDVVPWREGKAIYDNLQTPKRLELIEGAELGFVEKAPLIAKAKAYQETLTKLGKPRKERA